MPGYPYFYGGARGNVPFSTLSPTQADSFLILRAFLLQIVLPGTAVIQSQLNRVAEVKAADFVVMTPLRRDRIETNIDGYVDVQIIGAITGTILTVLSVQGGSLGVGSILYGPGISVGTKIVALVTGNGGAGTYTVSPPQIFPPSGAIGYFIIGVSAIEGGAPTAMYAGLNTYMQPTRWTVQLDVHGPNSADNAQTISTLFRDAFAVDAMGPTLSPLYADDPHQAPFVNDQNQYENRWIIEAVMQVNPVVTLPGVEFADTITLLPTIPADIPTAQ